MDRFDYLALALHPKRLPAILSGSYREREKHDCFPASMRCNRFCILHRSNRRPSWARKVARNHVCVLHNPEPPSRRKCSRLRSESWNSMRSSLDRYLDVSRGARGGRSRRSATRSRSISPRRSSLTTLRGAPQSTSIRSMLNRWAHVETSRIHSHFDFAHTYR